MADAEGTIPEDHEAADEIGKRILSGKTYSQSQNTETGEHPAEVEPERGQRVDRTHGEQCITSNSYDQLNCLR